ncbi:hypothetical protein ACFVGV_06020 [Pseudarthrobacter scleromae]|uniref:hypothetical protein n=1 Tax=Pseudarthrobacter scleromae TaxID=158897 RepID=UPI0036430704
MSYTITTEVTNNDEKTGLAIVAVNDGGFLADDVLAAIAREAYAQQPGRPVGEPSYKKLKRDIDGRALVVLKLPTYSE